MGDTGLEPVTPSVSCDKIANGKHAESNRSSSILREMKSIANARKSHAAFASVYRKRIAKKP
jgi:hypothetical protein